MATNNREKLSGEPPFSIPICVLVALFGMSTFLHVDTISAELPVLVQKLPEYWELPAYFSFIISVICTFPPLAYFAVHSLCPSTGGGGDHAVKLICTVFAAGIISSILLIILWDKTDVIAGSNHSTGFICLLFVLGSIDYVSLLMFVSYMVRLPGVYIPAFHVGEGLAGCVSSIVGIIQGAGSYDCVKKELNLSLTSGFNSTHEPYLELTNLTDLTAMDVVYREPLFSVEIYFGYLLVMVLICASCFLILHFLPYCQKFHIGGDKAKMTVVLEVNVEDFGADDFKRLQDGDSNNDGSNGQQHIELSDNNDNGLKEVSASLMHEGSKDGKANEKPGTQCIDTKTYVWLLFLTLWTGGVKYGAMDAVQSYSALPYGTVIFSLVNRLGLAAIPLSSCVAYVLPTRSITVINIHVLINLVAAVYVMVLAAMSPHPPMWDSNPSAGGAVVVCAWIIVSITLGYTRAAISSLIHERGERALVWFGMVYLLGTLIGNLPVFLCVSVFQLFEDTLPCTNG